MVAHPSVRIRRLTAALLALQNVLMSVTLSQAKQNFTPAEVILIGNPLGTPCRVNESRVLERFYRFPTTALPSVMEMSNTAAILA
jgi:hypothetical protein